MSRAQLRVQGKVLWADRSVEELLIPREPHATSCRNVPKTIKETQNRRNDANNDY